MNRASRLAALALLAIFAGAGDSVAARLESSAALSRELSRGRSAQVTLHWTTSALPGMPPRTVTGTLTLEAPDRVRLDLAGTGERLVARDDGSEWLQPATRQLLRFGAQQGAPALRWWRALLGDTSQVAERPLAPRRFALVQRTRAGVADSALVRLDGRGLPGELEIASGDGTLRYRLSGWRFARGRGPAYFRIVAPAGYETVDVR